MQIKSPHISVRAFLVCVLRYFKTQALHIWIVRPASAFWNNPGDILTWILNITGLTVHTVLAINLKLLRA